MLFVLGIVGIEIKKTRNSMQPCSLPGSFGGFKLYSICYSPQPKAKRYYGQFARVPQGIKAFPSVRKGVVGFPAYMNRGLSQPKLSTN